MTPEQRKTFDQAGERLKELEAQRKADPIYRVIAWAKKERSKVSILTYLDEERARAMAIEDLLSFLEEEFPEQWEAYRQDNSSGPNDVESGKV